MNNPIIIALDLESADEARTLVRNIGGACRFYKVGLELYAASGRAFVDELLADGNQVFLDLKMYDIGETVKRAVAQVAKMGVQFLTIHAVPQVMRAAMEGAAGTQLKLLAVTVLTSLDDDDLHEMGVASSVAELVEKRVRQTVEAKVHGLVCSPLEVGLVRQMTGPDAVLVTPGVRSAGAAVGDQKRVATPAQALAAGASYLVIGRQVTRSADPVAEVERILREASASSN
jgi:orotidine-5'-phosphate decarboxylase